MSRQNPLISGHASNTADLQMAAYPVLIPVYLAQYKVATPIKGELKEMTITAYIEAGVPNVRSPSSLRLRPLTIYCRAASQARPSPS